MITKPNFDKDIYSYAIENFELDDTYTLKDTENKRLGSYKFSSSIINRMLSKNITVHIDGKEKVVKNINNSELVVLIYLTQICSSAGNIQGVHYSEIVEHTTLSIKAVYNAIKGLEFKNYITREVNDFGYWNITILRNDYSSDKKDKITYVNTNRPVFIKSYKDDYSKFLKLTLQQKKLLFVFLCRYHQKYGYTKNLEALMTELRVTNYSRFKKYILDLNTIFTAASTENSSEESSSEDTTYKIINISTHKNKLRKCVVKILPRAMEMFSKDGVVEAQTSYIKRQLKRFVKHNSIILEEVFNHKKSSYYESIHGLIQKYQHLGISNVFKFICYVLSIEKNIRPGDMTRIDQLLGGIK